MWAMHDNLMSHTPSIVGWNLYPVCAHPQSSLSQAEELPLHSAPVIPDNPSSTPTRSRTGRPACCRQWHYMAKHSRGPGDKRCRLLANLVLNQD